MSLAPPFRHGFSPSGRLPGAAELLGDERRLARLGRRLLLATAVLLVLFVAYYGYDRYFVTVESPLDQAVRNLESKVRQSPNDVDLRMQVASGYAEQGRYDAAIAQYDQVLVLRENWVPAIEAKAAVEMQRGDDAAAESDYRKVADQFKDSQYRYASQDLQVVYYRLGVLASKSGRHAEAADWAGEALKVDDSDADALYLLASQDEALGSLEPARDAYHKAVSFDPTFRDAWVGLGRVASSLGDAPLAAYARGMDQLTGGDVTAALATLQQLVADSPDFAPAYEGLGLAYVKQGNADQAAQAFRSALDRDPSLKVSEWSLKAMGGAK